MLAGAPGVRSVVAFAGENQNEIVWHGEQQGPAGDTSADAANNFGFCLSRSPSGFLPFAHLGNREHRDGHGWNLTPRLTAESKKKRSNDSALPRADKNVDKNVRPPSGRGFAGVAAQGTTSAMPNDNSLAD